MNADVGGIWYGTIYTDGLAHLQGLQGGAGFGGPPRTHSISLWISYQGDYKNFGFGKVVSPISGQVDGLEWYSIPVSGFIDDKGLVELVFYLGSLSEDWTFSGTLTVRGSRGDISGNWTRMSWSNGLFMHQLGTMGVQKLVLSLSDYAYIVEYRHVF
jgi:hypothetical protein